MFFGIKVTHVVIGCLVTKRTKSERRAWELALFRYYLALMMRHSLLKQIIISLLYYCYYHIIFNLYFFSFCAYIFCYILLFVVVLVLGNVR